MQFQLSSVPSVSGQILLWAILIQGVRDKPTETVYTATLP